MTTKNETKHTPGPWLATLDRKRCAAVVQDCPERWPVAQPEGETFAEAMANARLIAAAPEMLKALRDLADRLEPLVGLGGSPTVERCYNDARAAISKATGEK